MEQAEDGLDALAGTMTSRRAKIALVASGITAAVAAAAMTPPWESTRRDIAEPAPAEHPRYATQTRSREAVRTAHLRESGSQVQDSAAEACERFSTATWAAKLGIRPSPGAVARTLARRYYEKALRDAAYQGCVGTLDDR